ncbi:MAG: hypothetical protein ACJ8AK_00625 [Gemmatimonadaceae bacterium]
MLSVRSNVSACLAVSLLVIGCARHHRFDDNPQLAEPQIAVTGPVVLEVENHNWSDIVLFVIHDGRTHRLAQIAAARDQTFEIPSHLIGDEGTIRLGLHRIGGRDDYNTEPISIRTGNTIRLTIEGKLEHSSIGVW